MAEDMEAKAGSYADLARRVDRVETNVATLQGTVSRVELLQQHAEEVNRLRFTALDASVAAVGATLTAFISRMEGIVSGEVQTSQTRAGTEMVAEYQLWRREVDARLLDENEVADYRDWRQDVDRFITQGRLLGRVVNILIGTNALAIIAAIWAITRP